MVYLMRISLPGTDDLLVSYWPEKPPKQHRLFLPLLVALLLRKIIHTLDAAFREISFLLNIEILLAVQFHSSGRCYGSG